MAAVQIALQNEGIISPSALSNLGKGDLRHYLSNVTSATDPENVQALWEKLFATATDPSVSDKYLTSACNVVSVFLLNAASSTVLEIKGYALSSLVWFQAFKCVHKAFADGKTKPALQVLETLAHMVRSQPDQEVAASILQRGSLSFLRTIFAGEPQIRMKEACLGLSCFLRRTNMSQHLEIICQTCILQLSSTWSHLREKHKIQPHDLPSDFPSTGQLLLALLFALRNLETRSAALKLFHLLCIYQQDQKSCFSHESLCAKVIEIYLRNNEEFLGDFADHVLPVVLGDEAQYQNFVQQYTPKPGDPMSRMVLFLAVLKIGRLRSFTSEEELPDVLNVIAGVHTSSPFPRGDRYATFKHLLRCTYPEIRIHTYSLLVTSFATNAIVPRAVLQCFLSSVKYLHDENDAHQRGEILSVTRKLVKRIESSSSTIQKLVEQNRDVLFGRSTLNEYSSFAKKLLNFLQNELSPNNSYSRHILALTTLQYALVLCERLSSDALLALFRPVANLILNAYDEVRQLSASICKTMMGSKVIDAGPLMDQRFVQGVVMLSARTGRSDHADAAGRLLTLSTSQSSTEHEIKLPGSENLTCAILFLPLTEKLHTYLAGCERLIPDSTFPLHGISLGIYHQLHSLYSSGRRLTYPEVQDLIKICEMVWSLVQRELCVDSPETASEEADDEGLSGPKDLLAYSWRALRDSSLVLQAVMNAAVEDAETFARIGTVCMEQLSMLRHRGAFSTVAQTFTECCERVRLANSPSIKNLITKWYEESLSEIDRQSTKLTRRSAGLPAMLTAILAPSDQGFFSQAMIKLVSRASKQVKLLALQDTNPSLPQVHALNCLKDIMTHSKFRNITESWLSGMLELAAKSLSSSIWAIRNCGLMLLRACINRLERKRFDGTSVSLQPKSSESSSVQPLFVALSLLKNAISNRCEEDGGREEQSLSALSSEKIFAALDLLRYVTWGTEESTKIYQLVKIQLQNPIWAIRDHSARVLTEQSSPHDMVEGLATTLAQQLSSTNELHGTLLLCRYALQKFWRVHDATSFKESLPQFSKLFRCLSLWLSTENAPFTRALILEIFNDAFRLYLNNSENFSDLGELLTEVGFAPLLIDPCGNTCLSARIALYRVHRTLDNPNEKIDTLQMHHLFSSPDESRYVVQNITEVISTAKPCFTTNFLIGVILTNNSNHDVALAMMKLSEMLELGQVPLSSVQAAQIREKLRLDGLCGRALRDASLRIEAYLLGPGFDRNQPQPPESSAQRLIRWLVSLKSACRDDLELDTRLNAAYSVAIYAPSFSSKIEEAEDRKVDMIGLELMCILHDLLNDDNQDVRKIAARTVAKIMEATTPTKALQAALCSLAAREELLDLMVQQYKSTAALTLLAIRKMTGSDQGDTNPILPVDGGGLFLKPVAETLIQIERGLNDLFAEERQNLYVDELDEIDQWSFALGGCNKNLPPTHIWSRATDWTLQGLDELVRINTSFSNMTNKSVLSEQRVTLGLASPLGPTYNAEILVVFVRVIMFAKVLCQPYLASDLDLETRIFRDGFNRLQEKLRLLQRSFQQTEVHDRVLQALKDAFLEG